MPPPCFQRPWRSISWVGAPFWATRRAMPTRPLWPLKNSQSAKSAGDLGLRKSKYLLVRVNAHWLDGVQGLLGGGGNGHHGSGSLYVRLGADRGRASAVVSILSKPHSALLLRPML